MTEEYIAAWTLKRQRPDHRPQSTLSSLTARLHQCLPFAIPGRLVLKELLFITFIMLVLPSSASAETMQTMQVNGVTRSFLLHVPANLAKPAPLLLALHGAGTGARKLASVSGFNQLADKNGFIVAYLVGKKAQWNDGRIAYSGAADDLGFVVHFVAKMEQQYHIDTSRIYVAGMSNGASMAAALACELPGKFAAIAVVSGVIPAAILSTCMHPVSVLQINGTADSVMLYKGGELRVPGLPGGVMTSVDETVAQWVTANGCKSLSAPVKLPVSNPTDSTRVSRRSGQGCQPGRDVVAYAIKGGAHGWPGGPNPRASKQMNASEVIVNFLLAHHR